MIFRKVPSPAATSAICWSPELALFCAVGSGVATSPDGITWTATAFPFGSGNASGVCWSSDLGLFVAVATGSDHILTSPDGITWTGLGQYWGTTLGFTGGGSACWTSDLGGLFVAVGFTNSHGHDSVFTSPDGVTWTGRGVVMDPSGSVGAQIRGVCWTGAQFVAVGNSIDSVGSPPHASNCISTSPDGATWTNRGNTLYLAAGQNVGATGVAWSDSLSLLVLTTIGGVLFSSPDGATWTSRGFYFNGSSNANANAICWSPDLAMFAAVGENQGGAGGGYPAAPCYVALSPDGTTWTTNLVLSGGGSSLFGVCWSPDLGYFAAIGSNVLLFPPGPSNVALVADFGL